MVSQVSAQSVYRWIIDRLDSESPPKAIDALARRALAELCRNADELELLVWREQILPEVKRALRAEHDRSVAAGIPVFELVGSGDDCVKGFAHALPKDSDAVATFRRLSSLRGRIAASLQQLTPRQFEALCCLLLERLGASEVRVTGRSRDGGIDFKGLVPLFRLLEAFGAASPEWLIDIQKRSIIHVVGQAKRWPTRPIQPVHLRELLGARDLYRFDAQPSIMGPVLGVFATVGAFTDMALTVGKRAGLVLLDGEWITSAAVLAGLGIAEADGQMVFEHTLLCQQLTGDG